VLKRFLWMCAGLVYCFGGGHVRASEGGADLSRVGPFGRWLIFLYNEHRVFYALFSVAVVASAGVLFGLLAEFLLSRLGLATKKMEHVE